MAKSNKETQKRVGNSLFFNLRQSIQITADIQIDQLLKGLNTQGISDNNNLLESHCIVDIKISHQIKLCPH
jgi:hypothetical protein